MERGLNLLGEQLANFTAEGWENLPLVDLNFFLLVYIRYQEARIAFHLISNP